MLGRLEKSAVNISDVLEQQADRPGAPPCIHLEQSGHLEQSAHLEQQRWSYRELNLQVWRIADLLHRRGVCPGDVVAHSFAGELPLLVCLLATARIGATVFCVPLNTPAPRRQQVLDEVGARWLATDIPALSYGLLPSIAVDLGEGDVSGFPLARDIRVENPLAPWIIVAGSGSTGQPKFMPVTHRQQRARMDAGLRWLPYGENDVLASLVELDFYGAAQRYLEAFTKGAGIALVNHTRLSLKTIGKGSPVTVIYGTAYHLEKLLKLLSESAPGYLRHLRALMIGGSTVSSRLRHRIREQLCPSLYVLYGANECHTTTITQLDSVFDIPDIVGRPHPGFEVQVVDDNGTPLPPDQAGQIRIRSEATIDGYFNNPAATARVFRNGWFYPGDIGMLTADGQLICLGRGDDMMIMNGINIYPAEIEQVMLSHGDVADAVALSFKHQVHQDIPVCAVSLFPGAQCTEQALVAHASQRLGAHGPWRVIILDAIPRNAQGKLARSKLIDMLSVKK